MAKPIHSASASLNPLHADATAINAKTYPVTVTIHELMAKEGMMKTFTSNSLHFQRGLLAAIAYQASGIPPSVHTGLM